MRDFPNAKIIQSTMSLKTDSFAARNQELEVKRKAIIRKLNLGNSSNYYSIPLMKKPDQLESERYQDKEPLEPSHFHGRAETRPSQPSRNSLLKGAASRGKLIGK